MVLYKHKDLLVMMETDLGDKIRCDSWCYGIWLQTKRPMMFTWVFEEGFRLRNGGGRVLRAGWNEYRHGEVGWRMGRALFSSFTLKIKGTCHLSICDYLEMQHGDFTGLGMRKSEFLSLFCLQCSVCPWNKVVSSSRALFNPHVMW